MWVLRERLRPGFRPAGASRFLPKGAKRGAPPVFDVSGLARDVTQRPLAKSFLPGLFGDDATLCRRLYAAASRGTSACPNRAARRFKSFSSRSG